MTHEATRLDEGRLMIEFQELRRSSQTGHIGESSNIEASASG